VDGHHVAGGDGVGSGGTGGGRPWQDAAAQVFVEDLDVPVLDPADAHHLGRVLRLRAGERVCAADGSGRWRPTVWTAAGDLEAVGAVAGPVDPPGDPVTIAFAPPKGDRPELVVQKLTELGVDRVVVLTTDRSVVRWRDERAQRHLERLRRVAREAAQQCRRLTLPAIESGDLAAMLAAGAALADQGGDRVGPADTTVAIGPEGGWSDGERAAAELAGARRVALAGHMLRAETAAIAAAVLLSAHRSW
jgi:16S rRNA (uracil1498-N3)-methyltransferase